MVDGDGIVIRTHTGAALLGGTSVNEVVLYEADHLDQHTRTGWSVMLTGQAIRITDPIKVARHQDLLIRLARAPAPHVDAGHALPLRTSLRGAGPPRWHRRPRQAMVPRTVTRAPA
ncbi:pyridoxamine 5'-phosphate oxidase family protein [Streptomyces echinatus]|uniref:pyridoxamine 5'-phosphate oxidase family protein n=1 Tax=Streptomyces echinatus TaxID=67293 RepID=UPI0037963E91